MTISQMMLRRDEFGLRLKHHEVRIVTLGNATLMRFTPSQPRRAFGHPPCDVHERETPAASLGPHHRQRQGKTGNPAPSRSKVSLVEPLHFWRAWRMIGCHQINDSLSKSLPQFFAILAAADRRSTLEQGLAIRDLFGGKMQIMRTRLGAGRQAF